jgi:hypothetical protein
VLTNLRLLSTNGIQQVDVNLRLSTADCSLRYHGSLLKTIEQSYTRPLPSSSLLYFFSFSNAGNILIFMIFLSLHDFLLKPAGAHVITSH